MPRVNPRLYLAQGIERRLYLRYVLLVIYSVSSSKLGFSLISYLPLSLESNIELSKILS